MESLGIKFPFTETYDGGIIGVTQTDIQKTKSDLLAFLVLKRGQRPMHNSLYSPIYDYIMEVWDEMTETSLNDDLRQKLNDFFPEIEVNNIAYSFEEAENLLHITIYYTIIDLKVKDNVSLDLVLES